MAYLKHHFSTSQNDLSGLGVTERQPILRTVNTPVELLEVRQLREDAYRAIYPSINVYRDSYDHSAIIFYSRDQDGKMQSTARLVVDGLHGLPEDPYFPQQVTEYRRQGKRLMEFGRFVIQQGNVRLLKSYYRTFYETAKQQQTDIILIALKPKDINFHQRVTGATLLSPDIGVSYGGRTPLACVAWNIERTCPRFFRWAGAER